MRQLALSKVYQRLEPGPVVFLATCDRGRTNIMTMSWHMMLDFEPPKIACVVSEGNYSFAALRKNRECVIAIPPASLAAVAVKVGNTHGDRVDKFAAFKLEQGRATCVDAPLVKECIANFECKVVEEIRKYDMFVLEVLKAWIEPALADAKTIHHCGYGKFVVDGKTIKLKSKMK